MNQIENQKKFDPLLEHLVKRGFTSVLVRYADRFDILNHQENQAEGIKVAIDYLNTKGVKPTGQYALIGSSLGESYVFPLAHKAKHNTAYRNPKS